ncbi:hydantoinase B/oxoprolinase family protein [Bradyrhizobium brasilense]|uniref:Hydantoinase B/oxoprolinase family protein n=1 Tax=Bradyrhizobium brasilense TaxID=1419277 RepID=A0ABY8JF59_9BRAD|nr:hydantoinase B/oxoprolinase family protein [Bradyrhizobium brasilense]WFU62593.1 hydantoinase B/oxoprolinase family protein [Bradyrhizobium brasilense]
MKAIDPISLALGQKQLDHICRTMGWVMARTARSPIFSQSHDFSCFIGNRSGQVVSQADGIPIHTGGGGIALTRLLETFEGRIKPGDCFLANDPYVAGGNHLPDFTVMRPVFLKDALIAFTCNRAHQSDIGGGAAGTYNPKAEEIFHEGLRIPVIKLVSKGEVQDDLWRLILLNSRTPDLLDGDLRAMLGSTEIGAKRVQDMASPMGADELNQLFASLLDWAEESFLAAIRKLKPGTYIGEDFFDHDCFEPVEARIKAAITVGADGLLVDFAGTSPQMRGFKNSSLANTRSAVLFGLISFLGAHIPRNDGVFRRVRVDAPEGSLVNAKPPAPVTSATTYPAHQIIHAIWQALSPTAPELSCAGWSRISHCNTSGTDGSRRYYVAYQWLAQPGAGAVKGRDGFNVLGQMTTLGGLALPEVEDFETSYPFLVERQEFVTDGGGPGRYRGGTGAVATIKVQYPAEYSFRGEGNGNPTSFGVLGGHAAGIGSCSIKFDDGSSYAPPRFGVERLLPLTLTIKAAGGGGYGSPYLRPAEEVLNDLLDGMVSREKAEADYGVVILAGKDLQIDEEATRVRRQQLKKVESRV